MSRTPIVDGTAALVPDDAEARRVASRRVRYGVRSLLWRESILRRVRYCGRFATGDTVSVRATPHGDGLRAGLGGVQTCGSVWACPVCSEKVNASRRADLEAGMTHWLDEGHAVAFLTLTLSHHKGDSLDGMWDAIARCWNKTVGGSGWHGSHGKPVHYRGGKADAVAHPDEGPFTGKYSRWSPGDRSLYGVAGQVRIVEVKHGDNGWHPHVHALLFLDKPLTARQMFTLRGRLYGRWETALAREGYRVSPQFGIDLRPVVSVGEVADYLTKSRYETTLSAAAYEVTGSHSKTAGKGGRTPFQVLADFAATGDLDDLNLWHEYEAASHARRQMTWSQGLRDLLALGVEQTDEEIVEDDHGGDALAFIDKDDYRDLAAAGMVPDVLEAAERGMWPLVSWLRSVGIEPTRGTFSDSVFGP